MTHIPAMPSAPSPSRQAKDAALLHSSNAWSSPQFVPSHGHVDVTSARHNPSNTLAPSSARSTQDQNFAFRYMPLILGLPLGFPGIEEVVLTDIYTYTHILVSQETATAERTWSVFKVCTNERPSPETNQRYQWFSRQPFAFLSKTEAVAHFSLRAGFAGKLLRTGWLSKW